MNEHLSCDAILFDMDGTLLDTVPLIVESFQYAFMNHLGHPGDRGEILAGIGIPLERVMDNYPEGPALIKTYLKHNQAHLNSHIGIFIGIPQMLAQLRKLGLQLGVVTSKRTAAAMPGLIAFDLEPCFDIILTKESTTRHKPDPEPLLEAMRRLHLSDPARVVYVGDSIHDVRCAQAAGCKTVVVDWTYMPVTELRQANPDLWLKKPADLVEWVVTG